MEELYPFNLKALTSADLEDKVGETYATDIAIMIDAKDRGEGDKRTLFTKEHFEEMIELENFILNLRTPAELEDQVKPEKITFFDLCRKSNITDEFIE